MRRVVERRDLEKEPHLIWNAFIDILAMESYADLSPIQRHAHLVFQYDSEVQNGGHGQYFENCGLDRLDETLAALAALGLPCQANLLSRTTAILSTREPGQEWDDVLDSSLIKELDDAYYRCEPTATKALERHLADHLVEYVTVT